MTSDSAFLSILSAAFRKLPSSRTKVRVGRVLSALWTRVGGRYLARVDVPGGRFILDVRSRTEAELIWNGEYDTDEVAFLAAATPDDAVFVDVGANVGLVLIQMLTSCSLSRAIGIEPIRVNIDRLERSVGLSPLASTCTLVRTALGAEEGELELAKEGGESVSDNAGVGLDGIVERVPMTTLDRLVAGLELARLDTIKIDVEGFEAHVFAGATETIARFRPVVYGEFNNELMPLLGTSFLDVWEIFVGLDYIACGFASPTELLVYRHPEPGLGNAALIPRERVAGLRAAGYTLTEVAS